MLVRDADRGHSWLNMDSLPLLPIEQLQMLPRRPLSRLQEPSESGCTVQPCFLPDVPAAPC